MRAIIGLIFFILIVNNIIFNVEDDSSYFTNTEAVRHVLEGEYDNGIIIHVAGADYKIIVNDQTVLFRVFDNGYLYSSQLGSGMSYYYKAGDTFNVQFDKLHLSRILF